MWTQILLIGSMEVPTLLLTVTMIQWEQRQMLHNTTDQNAINILTKCPLLSHGSTQNYSLLYFYWSKWKYLAQIGWEKGQDKNRGENNTECISVYWNPIIRADPLKLNFREKLFQMSRNRRPVCEYCGIYGLESHVVAHSAVTIFLVSCVTSILISASIVPISIPIQTYR